jgi:glycosyltransferase involved in cell wall biosynthesis
MKMSTATTSPALSVVVTVYTESVSVIETIDRLLRSDQGGLREIILVVSPRASKETMQICEDLAASHSMVRLHVQQQVPGVGWALREGMKLATHECVAIMSGDLETEPEAVERMFQKMNETGADVVIGSRWDKGGGFQNYDRVKYVLNWTFQKMFKVIYRTHINDLTYGFKILRKHVIESIEWESAFHEIYIETTVKPLKKGYHLEQVPTVWIGRREGESVNTFFRNFGYVKLALKVQAGS